MMIDAWLDGRNLPAPREERLEGEALAYTLVTYVVRRCNLPDEVVVRLAEDFLRGVIRVDGDH